MLRLLTQHVSLNEVAGYSEIAPNSVPLGADHLTLEGGVDDFEKKFPASPCQKKKNACSTNEIEKNPCTAASKKKNVAKLFHHSRGTSSSIYASKTPKLNTTKKNKSPPKKHVFV